MRKSDSANMIINNKWLSLPFTDVESTELIQKFKESHPTNLNEIHDELSFILFKVCDFTLINKVDLFISEMYAVLESVYDKNEISDFCKYMFLFLIEKNIKFDCYSNLFKTNSKYISWESIDELSEYVSLVLSKKNTEDDYLTKNLFRLINCYREHIIDLYCLGIIDLKPYETEIVMSLNEFTRPIYRRYLYKNKRYLELLKY